MGDGILRAHGKEKNMATLNLTRIWGLGVLGLTLFAESAFAVDPAPIKLGAADLVPQITIDHSHTDNLFFQPDDEVSSSITRYQPQLGLSFIGNKAHLEFNAKAEVGRYSDSPADDYEDYDFGSALDLKLHSRHALKLSANLIQEHEDRGTAFSAGNLNPDLEEPDTYEDMNLAANYRFGAQSAKGRLILAVSDTSREYTSRRDVTVERDRDSLDMRGTFLLRIANRTDALFEVRAVNTDYAVDPLGSELGLGSLDSGDRTYFIGLNWEATAKTEGSVRVGQTQKDFDSPMRDDFSGLSWEVSTVWSPKSYSKLTFSTSRRPIETDGSGSFIDEESWQLGWQHDWTSRITTEIDFSNVDRAYEGSADAREETTSRSKASLVYQVRRWLDMGISFEQIQKTSNLDSFEFDSNLLGLNATLSL